MVRALVEAEVSETVTVVLLPLAVMLVGLAEMEATGTIGAGLIVIL
jgi:hypothetical protein